MESPYNGTPPHENTVQYAVLKRAWERPARPTFNNTVENGLVEA